MKRDKRKTFLLLYKASPYITSLILQNIKYSFMFPNVSSGTLTLNNLSIESKVKKAPTVYNDNKQ